MTDVIAELLLRYELGDFSLRVRARLATIVRDDSSDALELLAKAAAFFGIRGATEATLARIEVFSGSRTRTSENTVIVEREE